jgi:cytoskeletal protein CcmA (bactofilin family)
MFSIAKNEQQQAVKRTNENQIDTLIGTSAMIKGDIISEGNVRIDGSFEGTIISKKQVIIGEPASVKGNIAANTIIIYGNVKGNIKSEGLLEIMPTGKLYGDIEVKSVSIKEGAVFQGKSIMDSEEDNIYTDEAAVTK